MNIKQARKYARSILAESPIYHKFSAEQKKDCVDDFVKTHLIIMEVEDDRQKESPLQSYKLQ